ncbi:MAG: hypothetical protein QOK39_440 [Acidimicrobiaceae bacterium]|nr:hypothetical protein [Acidimicrobiaceae bacterium]
MSSFRPRPVVGNHASLGPRDAHPIVRVGISILDIPEGTTKAGRNLRLSTGQSRLPEEA